MAKTLILLVLLGATSLVLGYPPEWDQETPMKRSRLRDRHFDVVDSHEGREIMILFALCVRGWNSAAAVPALERFLGRTRTPLKWVEDLDRKNLLLTRIEWARLSRNYKQLATSYQDILAKDFDLKKVSFKQLLTLYGVSFKTAAYFLTYTRPRYAGFVPDVHILRYLEEQGYPDIPKASPDKKDCATYLRLRGYYATEAKRLGMTFRELDTYIWESRATRGGKPIDKK